MNKFSKKRQAIERTYQKAKKSKAEKLPPVICQGCEKGGLPLSPSHLIPRSRRADLIDDEENIHWHCYGFTGCCHDLCEAGKYDQLKDGLKIKLYMIKKDIEYFKIKLFKNLKP